MAEENGEPKSPYGQYSEHDIMLVEAGNYYIQVGSDIFTLDGKMSFSRKRAEFIYDGIFKDLTLLKENGNSIEQEDAKTCLSMLRIFPMRVQ
jgi:hypothetical protein